MAEATEQDVFATRESPVPAFRFNITPTMTTTSASSASVSSRSGGHDGRSNGAGDGSASSSTDVEGKRSDLKSRLKNRLPSALQQTESSDTSAAPSSSSSLQGEQRHSASLQERMFAKIFQQIIPSDSAPDHESDKPGSAQTLKDIVRPGFSLPLMTSNFRRFNARIGVVFVFQVRITRLLTWRYPSQTLSFSLIYTFLCLNPHLIPMVPLVATLFFLLVPAYLSRHPPPPSTSITTYSLAGPPLAPARTIKPAPEISKDFFRNMRDLQNSMDDFATMHDLMVKLIAPATNFSNEPLSSALFQVLFLSCCTLFISAQLLPWRLIALIGGWSLLALGHPDVQELFMRSIYVEHVRPTTKAAKSEFEAWYKTDIILDAAPEVREVEIFELQRRTGLFSPSHASSDTPSPSSGTGDRDVGKDADYEPWLFAASAWEPLTPRRVAGERVKGTRFFEDVQPPSGWEWDGVKWELDLGAREWVEERLIGGVKVEVEGERWVFDSDDAEWRRRRWVRKVRRKVMISPAAAAPSVAAKDSDGKK